VEWDSKKKAGGEWVSEGEATAHHHPQVATKGEKGSGVYVEQQSKGGV